MTSTPRTLLVVHPPDLAQALGERVRGGGREVIVCATSSDARGSLLDAAVGLLVVSDVLSDGLCSDLVAELRDAGRSTPVIVVASRAIDGPTRETLMSRGATVLERDTTLDDIVRAIDAILAARPATLPPPSGDVVRALAALRADFAQRLPARMTELIASLERARASSESELEARALVHKLAGTAGSYGWRALSSALAEIEAELRRGDGARDWDRIDAATDAALLASSADWRLTE